MIDHPNRDSEFYPGTRLLVGWDSQRLVENAVGSCLAETLSVVGVANAVSGREYERFGYRHARAAFMTLRMSLI